MAAVYDLIDDFDEVPLFRNISPCDAVVALERVGATVEHLETGRRLFGNIQGIPMNCLYVINGQARAVTTDASGNRSILCDYARNDAIPPVDPSCAHDVPQIDIVATKPLDAISLPLDFEDNSAIAAQMEKNLVRALVESANRLLVHLSIVSERSTRNKVMAYLRSVKNSANSDTFEIPYTRQELADLLYVERSALSREISRLQEDGYIRYRRNTFALLK